jgi:type II secretory ATPase GspE/PulE/Tfp pilus assembly ATPase PilB-like protein
MNVVGREVSFRVATQPTIHGENIVLRVLDRQKALLPMEATGLQSASNVKLLQRMLKSARRYNHCNWSNGFR